MIERLGLVGVLGVLVLAAGLAVVTVGNPVVGGGLALVLLGIGIVVKKVVGDVLEEWGLA